MAAETSPIRRVIRSKDEARASYNRMSGWYDLLSGSSEKRLIAAGLQQLGVQAGERVLEIGVGTGHVLVDLANLAGPTGRVAGLDIAEGMLAVARRRLSRAGLAGRADLGLGDAARLPFKSAGMDAIWTSFTLELFDTPEIPIVLQECRRVLRPGGRLGIVAMSRTGHAGRMVKLYEWLHDRLPRTVDCRPIYVEEVVGRAGFHLVASRVASMWGLPVEIVLATC
jgi:demethylmenaquinone methyltransferase/2-methoxy-6-polyprenyl-1,4-benzoquinol methylase